MTYSNINSSGIEMKSLTFTREINSKLVPILGPIDLTIPKGIIFSLVGPSGCGKTTLIRCLTKFYQPSTGSIEIFGLKHHDPRLKIPGVNLGYMPQDSALNDDLTVSETINYFGRLSFLAQNVIDQRKSDLLQLLAINKPDALIGTLSGGQRRRVSFICSVIHQPQLIILDEPSVGIDPIIKETMWLYLESLVAQSRATVIVTTHYIDEARRTNLICFMRRGQIIASSDPGTILKHFGTTSLEKAFLELCKAESKRSGNSKPFRTDNYKQPDICSAKIGQDDSLGRQSRDLTDLDLNKSFYTWFHNFRIVFLKILLRLYKIKPVFFGSPLILIFLIFIFNLSYGRTPEGNPVGIVNDDHDQPHRPLKIPFSQIFLQNIDQKLVKLFNYSSLEEAHRATEDGLIFGFIHIKSGFSEYFTDRLTYSGRITAEQVHQSQIVFTRLFDHPISGITIQRTLERTLISTAEQIFTNLSFNPALSGLLIQSAEPIYPRLHPNDMFGTYTYFMPTQVVFLTHLSVLLLSTLSIAMERQDSMLERTIAIGVTRSQIFGANLAANLTVPVIGNILSLLIVVHLLGCPCQGSLLLVWLFNCLQLIGTVCMAYLFASLRMDFILLLAFTTAVTFVEIFVTGVIWTTQALPYFVNYAKYLTIYGPMMDTVVRVMSNGFTIDHPMVLGNIFHAIGFILIVALGCFKMNRDQV